MRALVVALALYLAAGTAQAQAQERPRFADLPPNPQVAAALAASPGVVGALSAVDVERARARGLAAGSYEFTLRADLARRRVSDPSDTYGEWGLALERPFRLPGKSQLDRQLGEQGVKVARLTAGDAVHEAGRSLLRLWFAWAKESAQLDSWRQQAVLAQDQLAAVQKRQRAGDAPKMEFNLAQAASVQAESNWIQARSREATARGALERSFPEITTPPRIVLLEPLPIENDLEYWSEQVLAHNHQLAAARAESERYSISGARMRAERRPDPTVGVRYGNEFGGSEKVAGVYLSVPIPGSARRAASEASTHQMAEAHAREAAIRRQSMVETAAALEQARAGYENWTRMRVAAEGLRRHADLVARAYQLGESALPEVLAARRMALEAELAAIGAQTEAQEARYRLLLDAHQLWPLSAGEADDHAGH